jgi:uncharacterized lipoprotein YajG
MSRRLRAWGLKNNVPFYNLLITRCRVYRNSVRRVFRRMKTIALVLLLTGCQAQPKPITITDCVVLPRNSYTININCNYNIS